MSDSRRSATPPARRRARRARRRHAVVSTPSNIRWLTSFGGSLGWVVVGRPDALVTDGRYAERAAADLAAAGSTPRSSSRHPAEIRELLVACAGGGPVRPRRPPHPRRLDRPGRRPRPAADDARSPAAAGQGRRRAGPDGAGRGDRRRRARRRSRRCSADGPTEADVRDELEHRMRRLGADGPSYDTIVASGPDNAARPHHQTGRRTIVEGDTVIIDVGALVDGYHSDMTRTFVVGEPTRRAAASLRPRARGPARRARRGRRRRRRRGTSTRRAATCSPTPATATGSSTAPATASGSTSTRTRSSSHGVRPTSCVVGDVVTVEPGLYRGGFGGVRIEDLVDGHRRRRPPPHPPVQGLPMPAITTNDLKTGITLELDNGLFQVVEFQHVKPGKGGAFVRTKLRNVRTGNVLERTFNAGIRVEQAIVDRQDMQFLYRDGDDYVFMNTSTYDQLTVPPVGARRRRRLPRRAGRRPDRPVPGPDHRRRDPGVGRADGHPDRARRAGRPGVRRPQAGRAGDRQDGAGAAVRRDRRPGQGRHPHRRLHHPRVMSDEPPKRPGPRGPTPASGRCTCSTRRRPRGSRRSTRSSCRSSSPTR